MLTKRTIYDSEHEIFRKTFRQFLKDEVLPHQEEWEHDGIVPRAIWKKCGEQGFLVPQADAAYGGLGIKDFRIEAIMLEELAYFNEYGLMLGLHTTIAAPYILAYGSDEQKQRIVPRITGGDAILAIAIFFL